MLEVGLIFWRLMMFRLEVMVELANFLFRVGFSFMTFISFRLLVAG